MIQGFRVRAGYNYGRMPLDPTSAFENLAFPAVAEHHLSGGVGVDVGPTTINLAVMVSPSAALSGANAAYPAQGGQAIASYTTQMSQLSLEGGLVWRL